MVLPIPPIPPSPPTPPASSAGSTPPAGSAHGFTSVLGGVLGHLQSTQVAAQQASLGVAAGTTSVSDMMVATTQAKLATELTVAVRNAAVSAFAKVMGI
ncbi:MAG: flagellar hook-basal body complex protein FliE [Acidimicrobiales bacterium]